MKSTFTVIALLLALFFSSCEKDYSFEGGGVPIGVASYTFNGGSNTCTGAVINGTFTQGTPVSSANTVTLNINVDSTGTYSISTPSVDGIIFRTAGIFTATGSQTVILTASGTPAAAGDFNFTAGTAGCSFSVSVDTIPAVPVDSVTYYYEATIDGVYHKETVMQTNGYKSGSGKVGIADVILLSNVIPAAYPPMPAGKTGMGFSKGILHNYTNINNTEFKTFFNLGIYPYSANQSVTDGVNVTWYDENGTEWSTDNGAADQTGSNFQIITVVDAAGTSGYYTIGVTAVFNCKLYDSNGNMKTLAAGKYYGQFEKQ
jgi:hypothetical protein